MQSIRNFRLPSGKFAEVSCTAPLMALGSMAQLTVSQVWSALVECGFQEWFRVRFRVRLAVITISRWCLRLKTTAFLCSFLNFGNIPFRNLKPLVMGNPSSPFAVRRRPSERGMSCGIPYLVPRG